MLKKLTLTVVERQLIARLLERVEGEVNLAAARSVREVRRRLDLREAGRQVEQVERLVADYRGDMRGLPWDDVADPSDMLADFRDRLAEEQAGETPDAAEMHRLERLLARLEDLPAEHEYTLDDAMLRWLQTLCTTVKWNMARNIDRSTGQVHTIEIPVDPALLVVFADVADKVTAALAAAPG